MDVFLARQAIFDRKMNVYAYELLFRTGKENVFNGTDADKATTSVITDSFLTIGLDSLTRGKRACINFTKSLLLVNTALILPKDFLVVEILEDVEPEPEIIEACKRLKKAGYSLALDDFIFEEKFQPLIELADIIKVDFTLSSPAEMRLLIDAYSDRKIRFLAEKVETQEEFDLALEMGYMLFQGYFFSKPVIVSSKDIPGYKFNYMNIITEINRPDIDVAKVENVIKQDVTLTYKLLKFINSAYFSFTSKIQSIKQALMLLGFDEFKKWVSLIILRGMGEEKPDELMVVSIMRAKFCEILAGHIGYGKRKSELFFMGMFSVIDVYMGRPMEEILEKLPIEDDIKDALLGHEGTLRNVYELMMATEKGDWDTTFQYADELKIDRSQISGLYVQALESANEIFSSLPSG